MQVAPQRRLALCYNISRNCGSKEPLFYLEKLSWYPEK
nr:MAG TPA: hypothetical protein [Caudoviricetes sp.]DAM65844.1 MAG TPA: hypothetical protein [Caudoviricetes sp.]